MTSLVGTLATGGLVGYVASRVMDTTTGPYYASQSDQSKRREEEIAPGGTLVAIGHQIGDMLGRAWTDQQAGRVGLAGHRTLGVLYGMGGATLVRRGMSPWVAGPMVAVAAWVVIDEGTAIAQFFDYPTEAHIRGVIGHSTLGITLAMLLWATSR